MLSTEPSQGARSTACGGLRRGRSAAASSAVKSYVQARVVADHSLSVGAAVRLCDVRGVTVGVLLAKMKLPAMRPARRADGVSVGEGWIAGRCFHRVSPPRGGARPVTTASAGHDSAIWGVALLYCRAPPCGREVGPCQWAFIAQVDGPGQPRLRFCTFPMALRGSSSRNRISRGRLWPESRAATNSTSSDSVTPSAAT